MVFVTGCKTDGRYKMHAPTFPYNSTVYCGYSLEEMKKKYRKDFGLKGKKIEWIILGEQSI